MKQRNKKLGGKKTIHEAAKIYYQIYSATDYHTWGTGGREVWYQVGSDDGFSKDFKVTVINIVKELKENMVTRR